MENVLGMMFEGMLVGILNGNEENADNKEIEKEENKDPIAELLGGIINGLIA